MTDKVTFDATNLDACTSGMNRLCNDGRAWTIRVVFCRVTAVAFDSTRRVPRVPAGADNHADTHFWMNGNWHQRRAATAAMTSKAWRDADRAAGVADGGGDDTTSIRRWFGRRAKINAKRLDAK